MTISTAVPARSSEMVNKRFSPLKAQAPDELVELSKWHNWTFDAIFYNVGRVPPELWNAYDDLLQGSVIVLKRSPDANALNGRTFSVVEKSRNANGIEMENIDALAIAGVGSSVLGTIALAVDVADALGGEVTIAGIVTGQGRKDVYEEGINGWYWLRPDNIFRQLSTTTLNFTKLLLSRNLGISTLITDKLLSAWPKPGPQVLPAPESQDIVSFLEKAKKLKLLVSHSKGNLHLAEALYALVENHSTSPQKADQLTALVKRLTIATFGAIIFHPPEFSRCMNQFVGELDSLGLTNSRFLVEKTVIPGVMHHLNTALPMHMSCSKVLRSHFPDLIDQTA